jgi:hypothetical protein
MARWRRWRRGAHAGVHGGHLVDPPPGTYGARPTAPLAGVVRCEAPPIRAGGGHRPRRSDRRRAAPTPARPTRTPAPRRTCTRSPVWSGNCGAAGRSGARTGAPGGRLSCGPNRRPPARSTPRSVAVEPGDRRSAAARPPGLAAEGVQNPASGTASTTTASPPTGVERHLPGVEVGPGAGARGRGIAHDGQPDPRQGTRIWWRPVTGWATTGCRCRPLDDSEVGAGRVRALVGERRRRHRPRPAPASSDDARAGAATRAVLAPHRQRQVDRAAGGAPAWTTAR